MSIEYYINKTLENLKRSPNDLSFREKQAYNEVPKHQYYKMEKLAKVVYYSYLFETIKNSPDSQIKIWQRKNLTKVKYKIILILRSKFGKDRI